MIGISSSENSNTIGLNVNFNLKENLETVTQNNSHEIAEKLITYFKANNEIVPKGDLETVRALVTKLESLGVKDGLTNIKMAIDFAAQPKVGTHSNEVPAQPNIGNKDARPQGPTFSNIGQANTVINLNELENNQGVEQEEKLTSKELAANIFKNAIDCSPASRQNLINMANFLNTLLKEPESKLNDKEMLQLYKDFPKYMDYTAIKDIDTFALGSVIRTFNEQISGISNKDLTKIVNMMPDNMQKAYTSIRLQVNQQIDSHKNFTAEEKAVHTTMKGTAEIINVFYGMIMDEAKKRNIDTKGMPELLSADMPADEIKMNFPTMIGSDLESNLLSKLNKIVDEKITDAIGVLMKEDIDPQALFDKIKDLQDTRNAILKPHSSSVYDLVDLLNPKMEKLLSENPDMRSSLAEKLNTPKVKDFLTEHIGIERDEEKDVKNLGIEKVLASFIGYTKEICSGNGQLKRAQSINNLDFKEQSFTFGDRFLRGLKNFFIKLFTLGLKSTSSLSDDEFKERMSSYVNDNCVNFYLYKKDLGGKELDFLQNIKDIISEANPNLDAKKIEHFTAMATEIINDKIKVWKNEHPQTCLNIDQDTYVHSLGDPQNIDDAANEILSMISLGLENTTEFIDMLEKMEVFAKEELREMARQKGVVGGPEHANVYRDAFARQWAKLSLAQKETCTNTLYSNQAKELFAGFDNLNSYYSNIIKNSDIISKDFLLLTDNLMCSIPGGWHYATDALLSFINHDNPQNEVFDFSSVKLDEVSVNMYIKLLTSLKTSTTEKYNKCLNDVFTAINSFSADDENSLNTVQISLDVISKYSSLNDNPNNIKRLGNYLIKDEPEGGKIFKDDENGTAKQKISTLKENLDHYINIRQGIIDNLQREIDNLPEKSSDCIDKKSRKLSLEAFLKDAINMKQILNSIQ